LKLSIDAAQFHRRVLGPGSACSLGPARFAAGLRDKPVTIRFRRPADMRGHSRVPDSSGVNCFTLARRKVCEHEITRPKSCRGDANARSDRNHYRGRDWPDLVGGRDVQVGPGAKRGNEFGRIASHAGSELPSVNGIRCDPFPCRSGESLSIKSGLSNCYYFLHRRVQLIGSHCVAIQISDRFQRSRRAMTAMA